MSIFNSCSEKVKYISMYLSPCIDLLIIFISSDISLRIQLYNILTKLDLPTPLDPTIMLSLSFNSNSKFSKDKNPLIFNF